MNIKKFFPWLFILGLLGVILFYAGQLIGSIADFISGWFK